MLTPQPIDLQRELLHSTYTRACANLPNTLGPTLSNPWNRKQTSSFPLGYTSRIPDNYVALSLFSRNQPPTLLCWYLLIFFVIWALNRGTPNSPPPKPPRVSCTSTRDWGPSSSAVLPSDSTQLHPPRQPCLSSNSRITISFRSGDKRDRWECE